MPPSVAQPLVSIVVPSFNGERFIVEALESCLAQTYKNIEVICLMTAVLNTQPGMPKPSAAQKRGYISFSEM